MRSVLLLRWFTGARERMHHQYRCHAHPKKWCACVHVYEGYYLTMVKKNRPQMYEDLVDFFADLDTEQEEWQYTKIVQKGHSRVEIRELWASPQMKEWFET